VVAIAAIVLLLPVMFPKIWRLQLTETDLTHLPHPQINHPRVLLLGGLIVSIVLALFVFGEMLPVPLSPAAAALLGAALALWLAHHSKIDTVNNILRDVDWSTLLFFMCVFVLIGGLEDTGVIYRLSDLLGWTLGRNIMLGALVLVFLVGLLSSIIPNIPLVVAMVPLLKQYLVGVGLLGSEVLAPDFAGQLPPEVLPLFYAMMFGATLGGNGTLVGASSNIVAAGVAEQHGKSITFHRFLYYGIPVMLIQLIVAALYVRLRF
jgi:Na+/H+ antiporter NhaD/arsenite permease-like protein